MGKHQADDGAADRERVLAAAVKIRMREIRAAGGNPEAALKSLPASTQAAVRRAR